LKRGKLLLDFVYVQAAYILFFSISSGEKYFLPNNKNLKLSFKGCHYYRDSDARRKRRELTNQIAATQELRSYFIKCMTQQVIESHDSASNRIGLLCITLMLTKLNYIKFYGYITIIIIIIIIKHHHYHHHNHHYHHQHQSLTILFYFDHFLD